MPLTFKQTQSTKAMQALQPKLQEIQKKYARNQQKLQQEMMRLYKEAGINPLGCMWPMLIQMPIWIALYQSIMQALAATPENLLMLSQHLYSWDMVGQAIPLNENFLGLKLSQPDPTLDTGYPGGRYHVGAAEDGHTALHRPAAAANVQHDDPDDADDVRILHTVIPQRPGPLLGGIKYYRNRDTVLRRWWLGLLHHSPHSDLNRRQLAPQNQHSKALKEGTEKKKG